MLKDKSLGGQEEAGMRQKQQPAQRRCGRCLSVFPVGHRPLSCLLIFSLYSYILAPYPAESGPSVFPDFNLIVALSFYLLTLVHFQLNLLTAVNAGSVCVGS